MKSKLTILIAALLVTAIRLAASDAMLKNSATTALDERIAGLLSQMTTAEKVGQMTQVTIDVIADLDRPHGGWQQLDSTKLRTAIVEHHVGSILNVMGSAYTMENWHEIITQIQDVALKETRLGIPIIYGIDAIHGVNYTIGATIFPQSLGMAATGNVELMKKDGEITALETRASGIPWNFNPVLGAGRQPLWPRLFETFGEDTYLASVMGAAYVKGLEGDDNDVSRRDKVAACIKHYLGYSYPFTGKDRTPAYIPERQLREHFVPIFKAGIDAGSHTVMINSSEINGVPVHSSYYFLTQMLRDELGFQGFVVSDWEDINNLFRREKVADSPKEAVRQAVQAGIDMSMVPLDYKFYDHLMELVDEGSVPVARIDEAVARILRVKFQLGLFENAYPDTSLKKKFASSEHQQVALQAARESIVLLKNDKQLLPLSGTPRILVTGPSANKLAPMNGGWTITWQGNDESLYPKEKDTILEALQKKFGEQNVTHVPGAGFNEKIDVTAASQAAAEADVIVLCLGEDAYCETPGTITDLTLPQPQIELARAVQAVGKPVVLILTEGRPRIIRGIEPGCGAILAAFLPGVEGGTALAEIIAGEINPSGKLPVTYPRHVNDLTLYDHKFSENANEHLSYNPQFGFGHGLSYTTFTYSDLHLAKKQINKGEALKIDVTVANTGARPGQEIVQLYLTDVYASVTPCNRRLKRFEKVSLAAGESTVVSFNLDENDFAFIGRENVPVVEPGEFLVSVGGLSAGFVLRGEKSKSVPKGPKKPASTSSQ